MSISKIKVGTTEHDLVASKALSSNKTGTKMFIIGVASQSTSGETTYSNSNCYIGTDNCLYSGGEKVSTAQITTISSAKIAALFS